MKTFTAAKFARAFVVSQGNVAVQNLFVFGGRNFHGEYLSLALTISLMR